MKKYIIAATIPLTFWFTPNAITKINYSKELKDIELFDNGTVCAKHYDQQVYFRAFPKEENQTAKSFLADTVCESLRSRNTFDNFYENLDSRIEIWKHLLSNS